MTGTALVLAREAMPYTWAPSLIAWWTGTRYTEWHITLGPRTRCGRLIPIERTARATRRHHPAANVCAHCLTPRNENPADAVTSTGPGADAVEPGAALNLDPAREGCKP